MVRARSANADAAGDVQATFRRMHASAEGVLSNIVVTADHMVAAARVGQQFKAVKASELIAGELDILACL